MASSNSTPLSILCIASFFKGEDFMRALKAEGCTVYLITSNQLKDAEWPHDSIDEIFYVNDINGEKGVWNMAEVIAGLAWVDALLNASMILGGMGPVDTLPTQSAKIFASLYALFCGLVFVGTMGLVISPILHRMLHKFHIDDADVSSEE